MDQSDKGDKKSSYSGYDVNIEIKFTDVDYERKREFKSDPMTGLVTITGL